MNVPGVSDMRKTTYCKGYKNLSLSLILVFRGAGMAELVW